MCVATMLRLILPSGTGAFRTRKDLDQMGCINLDSQAGTYLHGLWIISREHTQYCGL